jgi:predicted aspartyl protease
VGLRKLCGLLFYAIVTVCCVAQTVSESRAASEGSKEENWRLVGQSVIYGGVSTKVTVVGNSVLVPATLVYRGNQADVQLLLDTGSSRTTISTEIADRLNIDPTEGRKVRAQVVGGAVIEARQFRLTSVTVGPHTKKEADILIVQHKGPPVRHDGLLGMDLLRGLKFNIDFEKQIMIWE